MTVAITDFGLVSPYGIGQAALWQGLVRGETAIKECTRFDTAGFTSPNAGTVTGLVMGAEESLLLQMLTRLFGAAGCRIPEDAFPIVATTTGEIDLLEAAATGSARSPDESILADLPAKIAALTGTCRPGMIVSAACASATVAAARALSLIRSGAEECVLVVAADCVSEFVFSGFSSLMALDPERARPFDCNRRGLTIGEAAAYVMFMSRERAQREGVPEKATILGAGLTNDANHMTGPSRDGAGLARAIYAALSAAGTIASDIGFIAAHGTGTEYNDAMEMKALQSVFAPPRPTFSIKGGTGHTMGSAGLLQCIVAIAVLEYGMVPPTVGLRDVTDDANGWAASVGQKCAADAGLVLNAGFGGVNAAVVVSK